MSWLVDTFTDTDGTDIETHTPDTGDAWAAGDPSTIEIQGNELVTTDLSAETVNTTVPASADYEVLFDLAVEAADRTTRVYARRSTSADDGCYAYVLGGSGRCYFGTRVASVDTDLLTRYDYGVPSTGITMHGKLVVNGTAIELWMDTAGDGVLVQRKATTQSAVAAAGKVSAYTSCRLANPGVTLTRIEATDLGTGLIEVAGELNATANADAVLQPSTNYTGGYYYRTSVVG